jgi:DNA-binding MarR family transcriptional regulator
MDGEVMSDNSFFKPTLLYKEFMILDLIEKDANITQREISKTIGVAVSMVNQYIENFVKKGLIEKKKHSTKNVEYFITKEGAERRKLLNINYLHNSQRIYDLAKANIKKFLEELSNKGIYYLLIYGAGEVATIILNVLVSENMHSKFELSIIDDDKTKVGNQIAGIQIYSPQEIDKISFDSVFLGSYTYREIMYLKALNMGISKEKIIKYFY